MYFDFEDNHPDITPVGHALTWRDGFFAALTLHLLAIIAVLIAPEVDQAALEARLAEQAALQQQQRERESPRFVFVQPRVEMPAVRPPTPRAEASDRDRNAQTRERPPNPTNPLPFSRGNTPERVEAIAPPQPSPQRPEAAPQPTPPSAQPSNSQSSAEAGSPPPSATANGLVLGQRAGSGKVPEAQGDSGTGAGKGLMSSAMRDLQQYMRSESFDNQGGGNSPYGQAIQFDTKGVEFGPWLRRFVAQIKRNWFIPMAAMAMKGHVVITFYIHKDGSITQLSVPGPCNVDAFNRAAFNAMAASNPTYPLPPEYPSERAFFTVTFYYNENPSGGPPY